MIVIAGAAPSLDAAQWAGTERAVLMQKQRSPVKYAYATEGQLRFELRLRANIVAAARALNASGVQFATFSKSRCNEAYWERTEDGGFRLRPEATPAAGIRDIYENGHKYAFECAAAVVIVLYKGVLDTIGDADFNRQFANLFLRDWHYDRDLQLVTEQNAYESFPGDIRYFKNPDHDPEKPQWQGENVVQLDENLYYGHGFGIQTGEAMIADLNALRRRNATLSAYLTGDVVHPDFTALMMAAGEDMRRPAAVRARIGGLTYIVG